MCHPDSPPETSLQPIAVIPTGSLALDQLLGIGGLPRGQITEIYGAELAGKTSLALHFAAAAQRGGGLCAWIDTDCTLTPAHAIQCGVNPSAMYLASPRNAEQALSILEALARSGCMHLIVLDSVGTLVGQAELQTPLGKSAPTSSDLLLSQALPVLAQAALRSNTALLFTNQIWPGKPPVYHHLGQHLECLALKLQAAIRLQLAPLSEQARPMTGSPYRQRLRCVKNQFVSNNRVIWVDIVYNELDQAAQMHFRPIP